MVPATAERSAAQARVAISSTPPNLEPYRAAALEVAQELGFHPSLLAPRPDSSVQETCRQVAEADLLLAIVGWHRGDLPTPEHGGDGQRSWTAWQVHAAIERAQPLVVMMAGDDWPKSRREEDADARAWLLDFRGDLHSLAVFFGPEADGTLSDFRQLLRRELARHQPDRARATRRIEPRIHPPEDSELRPRRWPQPELPERPYPLLLPYGHPDLLAGRERELAEAEQLLRLPIPILGLYAPSGAGKSSFLAAGLVPRLDAAGLAVSFDRHPSEPGLARRLIGDLLDADAPDLLRISDEDREGFVQSLLTAHTQTGQPPILILDQFEDLLLSTGGDSTLHRQARAVVGMLLAASLQRQPGCDGPLCRWLLAYRQEFHGEVFLWLGDALREARSLGRIGAGTLPHDLSGSERFHAWSLQPLGVPRSGTDRPLVEATRIFQAVIEKPLQLRDARGQPHYPWRFAEGHSQRLAQAFGEARLAHPKAPLVPELQVVLAHLLERAAPSADGGGAVIEVPEEPGELISQALEQHVQRALDAAFPSAQRSGQDEEARVGRTRALLALRELAEVSSQRGALAEEELARAIGRDGRTVLEKLATPQTRLVVAQQQAGEWTYVLSNDRLAEVLIRWVDEEGGSPGLGLDSELLRLRRFVALKSALFAAGEIEPATDLTVRNLAQIETHAAALLWGEERQQWWQACQTRFQTQHQRRFRRRALTLAMLMTVATAWLLTSRCAGPPESAESTFGNTGAGVSLKILQDPER